MLLPDESSQVQPSVKENISGIQRRRNVAQSAFCIFDIQTCSSLPICATFETLLIENLIVLKSFFRKKEQQNWMYCGTSQNKFQQKI